MLVGRNVFGYLASLLVYGIGVCLPATAGAQHDAAPADVAVVRSAHATVESANGVARERAATVASEVDRLFTLIGRDLADSPPRLQVRLYSTHVAFAGALRSVLGAHPQSSEDNTSAVVHNTLLIGPVPASYLHHNLAHVYTEWLIDRLTGNRTDAL